MKFPAVQLAAALLLSAPLALAKPVPINGFAAKVNGKVITKSELGEAMKFRKAMIARNPDSSERAKLINSLRADTLEALIDRELALSEFEKHGGQVKPEMIDDNINRIIRQDFDGKRPQFLAELKKQGTTIEKFRKMQEKQIARNYMLSTAVKDLPVATPTDIKSFYDKNPTLFRDAGFIRLRMMTIPKTGGEVDPEGQKKLVGEIHRKLKAGDDFGTLAKTYSIDSYASEGGDRGTIGPDNKEMRPDLVALAFAQPTGKVSDLHQDQGFYYIMKVESRKLGKRAPLTDPKVRDAIEKRLKSEKRKAAQDRWLANLKKTAIIKRY